ncbi:hypothetical protein K503DRAFT_776723 [Rhizopogon vinicolor AM-OR11-026]|uniref:Uncharacterized protein n=1 Tax=Rhizopogon vinicolor AM-OR11-026 TaxID=1314800 RepID=A0A1B7MIF6_9AGAM|nr:hypothetical protein K503DRAFT_776723 [Rhizopogon vinicolor AM-OR11-026]
MKYISLTAMIMSIALASIATAANPNPNGETCTDVGAIDCGILACFNNGHSFLYYCMGEESNPDIGRMYVAQNCSCAGCCDMSDGCTVHP